jgi:Tol biopolymer transport system component
MADRDGANRRVLAWQVGGVYARPTWSPDGARLAFAFAGSMGGNGGTPGTGEQDAGRNAQRPHGRRRPCGRCA